jgi:hypothetical protein
MLRQLLAVAAALATIQSGGAFELIIPKEDESFSSTTMLKSGAWYQKRLVDEVTDDVTYSAWTFIPTPWTDQTKSYTWSYLWIQCSNKITTASFHFGTLLRLSSEQDTIIVTTRLDDDPPATERWVIGKDGYTAYAPKPMDFLRKLAKAGDQGTFRVRADTPYLGKQIYILNLDGLPTMAAEVGKVCGWKL